MITPGTWVIQDRYFGVETDLGFVLIGEVCKENPDWEENIKAIVEAVNKGANNG